MRQLLAMVTLALFMAPNSLFAQFTITSSVPHKNEVGVALDSNPVLQFSENIDIGSAANAFLIVSNMRGKLACSITVLGNSVTLTPSSAFISSEEITISILGSLKSTSAIPLATPTFFRFKTGSSPSIVNPPNMVRRRILESPGQQIATADLDGDADLDICFSYPNKLIWLENDGLGAFSIHETAISSNWSLDLKPCDIDQDGDVDILNADPHHGITIYDNNGLGEFSADTVLPTPGSGIDIADLNADGFLDIVFSSSEVVNQMYVEATYVHYQDATGAFTKVKISSELAGSKCIDVDNDGDWDILKHDDHEIYYLLNTGTEFVRTTLFKTENVIESLIVCNFGKDEHFDIIVGENGYWNTSLNVLIDAASQHSSLISISSEYGLRYLTADDFDGDHDTDVIVLDVSYNHVMLENDGDLNFTKKMLGIRGEAGYSSSTTINGDFNADGVVDYVSISNPTSGSGFLDFFENTIFPIANDASAGISELSGGDADWGDFDDDGDLDLLTTGYNAENDKMEAILYENQLGSFVEVPTSIVQTAFGSCDWGDFDNDGDPDILMLGKIESAPKTFVYKNENGQFSLLESSEVQLPDVLYGKARWADMDNDGLLDVVFNAKDFSGIYKGDGRGSFTRALVLPKTYEGGSVSCADYDSDGDLDLAMSGMGETFGIGGLLKVFRNEGNWVFDEVPGNFSGLVGGNLNWADMDTDGDLDLVASGVISYNGGWSGSPSVKVYENLGDSFQSIENNNFLYHTDNYGTTATGDFDNDGIPDVICSTRGNSVFDPMLTLLRNDGTGDLTIDEFELPKTATRVINWIDYDLDHDLDIFTGIELLRNNVDKKNSPPTKPSGIHVDSVFNNTIYLKWNPATDNETSQASLSYQIYAGTQPKGTNIVNPNADITNGFRKIAESGNANGTSTIVTNLSGGTYYFGVQSIDASFEGSAFSDEGQVSVIGIHGQSNSCVGLEHSYSGSPAGNYTWQVIGGTLLSGQGTDNITVRWDNIGEGFVKVSNGAGLKNTLVVKVDDVPHPVISGDETTCTAMQPYVISDHLSHSVEWTVAGVPLQDQSTTSVTIDFTEAGDYEVAAKAFSEHKGCFSHATLQVSVDQRPDPTITQHDVACQGARAKFSTTATDVEWNAIGGRIAVIRDSWMEVEWGNSGSGIVHVDATSERAFCVESGELTVQIHDLPPKPTLKITGDNIIYTTSPSPGGYYSWYYYNDLVVTGPYDGIIPYVSGDFIVEVYSEEGCGNKSDPFHFYLDGDVTEVEEPILTVSGIPFNIYPNPADDKIDLEIPEEIRGPFELEIYSATYSSRGNVKYANADHLRSHGIDVSRLAPGVYVVVVRAPNGTYQARFVKR